MKRWLLRSLPIIAIVLVLPGCFFPQERKVENQVPYEEQIASVQRAVDKYQEANEGLLPIKEKEMGTPIYQKYPIDFKKLIPQFLEAPPGNAYENGGVYQYVLIDVETNPTVKVFDLHIAEKIRELKIRMQAYRYPPFKETLADNVFTLDYKKLGYEEEQYATSPYTNNNLPFVINGEGEIFVDYISDLYNALQEEKTTFKQGEDIRPILHKNSPIVPAFSIPYTIDENNEPIYMAK